MILFFWICFAIIVYTFIGYGLVLFGLVKAKRFFKRKQNLKNTQRTPLPSCSILIAAYNEEAFIKQKILNTLSINYPADRLKIFVVADGSTDQTTKIIEDFPQVILLYTASRMGKVHAINRAMQFIDSEIVVFTDANTFLNKDAVINICKNYCDANVGGVAGEKRIFINAEADASTAGENMYWKYESKLKQWDSELNTSIGAAGELFSIRRDLYQPVPENTILDDFIISMRIAIQGFKVVYEPKAYAIETSSLSINEELKRKIRIAAGGIQSIVALKELLSPFKQPLLTFQYISHRVLRWSITPFLLIIVLILNILIVFSLKSSNLVYQQILISQTTFYLLAFLGFILEKKKLKFKLAFIPYYFCVMNYSVVTGILKYLKKEQSSVWEKAVRREPIEEAIITLDQK